MGFFQIKNKKEKRWICTHCKRINAEDDSNCLFCQLPKEEKETPKNLKKVKAYDEIYLWPIFSEFIRLRDSDKQGICRCFTCGLIRPWRKMDCGHGAGRQHKATKYNEQNNHAQCKKCNGFEGGMRDKYKIAMDRKYGSGTWDKMEIASRGIAKFGKVDVDFMAAHYQKEVEKLKKEKGII